MNFLKYIGDSIGHQIIELMRATNYPDIVMKADMKKIIDKMYDFGEYNLDIQADGAGWHLTIEFKDPNLVKEQKHRLKIKL